jgi:hypothetical protein
MQGFFPFDFAQGQNDDCEKCGLNDDKGERGVKRPPFRGGLEFGTGIWLSTLAFG